MDAPVLLRAAQDPQRVFRCCCNVVQKEIIITMVITLAICTLTWNRMLLAPIKLIAVFLHEFGHASAAWLSGANVAHMEVNEKFGGVTHFRGGVLWLILPAGYTGSVIWGSFFVLMTWSALSLRIAAVLFVIAAVATMGCLRMKGTTVFCAACALGLALRILILLVAAIVIGLWVLEAYVKLSFSPLRWCMVSFGTMCVFYAVYDCFEDVVCRRVDGKQGKSDAVLFHEAFGGSPYFWGTLWAIISIAAAAGAIYGAVVLSSDRCVRT